MSEHYTIVNGDGEHVTSVLQEHDVERVALACANRLGRAVWAHESDLDAVEGADSVSTEGETASGTRYDPSVDVEAWNPVPSDCLPGGIDVDVTVTLGEVDLTGEVTLCPDRINGGWVAYGDGAEHWVSGGLLRELAARCRDGRDTGALRGVLDEIEAAAVEAVTDEVAAAVSQASDDEERKYLDDQDARLEADQERRDNQAERDAEVQS